MYSCSTSPLTLGQWKHCSSQPVPSSAHFSVSGIHEVERLCPGRLMLRFWRHPVQPQCRVLPRRLVAEDLAKRTVVWDVPYPSHPARTSPIRNPTPFQQVGIYMPHRLWRPSGVGGDNGQRFTLTFFFSRICIRGGLLILAKPMGTDFVSLWVLRTVFVLNLSDKSERMNQSSYLAAIA